MRISDWSSDVGSSDLGPAGQSDDKGVHEEQGLRREATRRVASWRGARQPRAFARIPGISSRGNAMDPILVGKAVTTPTSLPASQGKVFLQPKFGNRHGLVAGATGTGKTVTLTTIAEGFSHIGVPVFMADVKGDVAGLAAAGTLNEKLQARIDEIGIDGYTSEASPVIFWDLYGKLGHPVRTTVSEVGPTLLARMLELNDTQSGVLEQIGRAHV